MKNLFTTKHVVATGIGAAIFLVLFTYVKIPAPIPNTSLHTAFAFGAFLSMVFGPLVGALAAFFGHLLSDMINGYGFWLNWYIASALSMGITGLAYFYTKFKDGECRVKDIIIFNIFQLIGQCLAFGIFAPVVDVYLYAEPWNKVIAQGFVASLVNFVTVAVVSTPLLYYYAKNNSKKGSLTKGK